MEVSDEERLKNAEEAFDVLADTLCDLESEYGLEATVEALFRIYMTTVREMTNDTNLLEVTVKELGEMVHSLSRGEPVKDYMDDDTDKEE